MKTLKLLLAAALVALLPVCALAQSSGVASDTFARLNGAGPVPTLSSCSTGPTLATGSNDTVGRITLGTGTLTACTVTFSKAYANAPTCYFNDETTPNVTNGTSVIYKVVPSTTAVTVTFAITATTADKVTYLCVGF